MKVCIYYRALSTFYAYCIDSIKNKFGSDTEIICVVQNDIEEQRVLKEKDSSVEIINVSKYFKDNWESFNLNKLRQYEDQYARLPFWSYLYSDRFLVSHSYDYCVKIACGYFKLYDEIFRTRRFDYYIDETIAILASYIGYLVATANGSEYCAMMLTRGFETERHYFLDGPMQYNCNFDTEYISKKYPDEIKEKAITYIKKMQSDIIKPSYMKNTGVKPKFHLGYIKVPFIYLKRNASYLYSNMYDYVSYRQAFHTFDPIKFYFQYLSYRKYYRLPDFNKKFVYFPLHYQPEATTLVCAAKFEKQIFVIDEIAKSLPADTFLYVKEHYAILGHREPDFYKKLQHYPNVVLIDPWVQSKDLILRCESVITLTGTAGWEGFILGKPVFMGGHMFYENAPGVIHLDDFYLKYTELIEKWKRPTDTEITQYVCEHLQSSFEGCQVFGLSNHNSPENLKKLGESMACEIQRREKKRMRI